MSNPSMSNPSMSNPLMSVAYDDLTIETDQVGWKTDFIPIVDAASEIVIGAEVRSSTNCLTSLPIQIWRRELLNALMRSVLARQRDRTMPAMSITMPLGLRHLASPLFTRSVRAAVAGSGINPSLLVLSIADDILVHADESRLRLLNDMSNANIQLCVQGPNACTQLARHSELLAFHQIRIPMGGAAGDPGVHRMVARAHGIDLEVIASDVSTEEELNDARRFGARRVIGPLFSDDDDLTRAFSAATIS